MTANCQDPLSARSPAAASEEFAEHLESAVMWSGPAAATF